ncbi:hypothetical protein [Shinella sp.]|uniref:hypothetical protein n=1 Tax=Shinella sp. TaxID=1870904 RepID=UPI00301BB949
MTGRTKAAFERRDVRAGRVLLFAAAVTAGLVAAFAFVGWLVHIFHVQPPGGRSEIREGIRLQVDPAGERQRLQGKAAARLSGYGWVDASAGRVHIPIERAMRLLAERGWPDETVDPKENGK